jgi:long-subunit fatty acid transport protein
VLLGRKNKKNEKQSYHKSKGASYLNTSFSPSGLLPIPLGVFPMTNQEEFIQDYVTRYGYDLGWENDDTTI